jgi:hypothetical protein
MSHPTTLQVRTGFPAKCVNNLQVVRRITSHAASWGFGAKACGNQVFVVSFSVDATSVNACFN